MIPAIIQTFLISTLPFVELRLGIPIGYLHFDLPIWIAVATGIVGNFVAVALVLYYLPLVVAYLDKFPRFKKTMDKIFDKTRADHSHRMIVWGEIFLVFFIAIPLPGSGGWTGVLLAFLFGIPYKKVLPFIALGVFLAGIIMGIISVQADVFVNFFKDFI